MSTQLVIPPDVQAEIDRFSARMDALEEKIRQRYFPDPIAWASLSRLNAEDFALIEEYTLYALGCEIEKLTPMDFDKFADIPQLERSQIVSHADEIILPE